MEKSINKILNISLIVVIFLIIVVLIINILTPLLYNENSKTYGGSYDYLSESQIIIEKYLKYIMEKNYESINSCLALIRKKPNSVYDNYSIYLNENYKEVNILKVERISLKNYLVTYTISTGRENKIILHFDSEAKTAKIYYDKLLLQF